MKTFLKLQLVNQKLAKKFLPTRTQHMNKTHGGKLLIVGGSKGMYGAGILCALAGTRAGAGYTYLMMDWLGKHVLKHPDILFLKPDVKKLNTLKMTAYVFGPGVGRSMKSARLLKSLISKKVPFAVLDADGLNLLAKFGNVKLPSGWVLTPHEGEMARLLGVSAEEIRKDPPHYITEAHRKYGCVVLLKGASTYISDGSKIYICKSGTPALAKAGTGDVLSGIIGALLAQGLSSALAAALGAYIHGTSSQKFLRDGNDVISLRPTDLIEYLPKILKAIRR